MNYQDLQELVKKLKYETNLNELFQETKHKFVMQYNRYILEDVDVRQWDNDPLRLYMIAALAVTDQKNGQEPTSSNPWYLEVYRAAQEV